MISAQEPVGGALSAEAALECIVQGIAGTTAQEFFQRLVYHLAAALGMRHALVGELIGGPGGKVRTLACWSGQRFDQDSEYELAATPCERVVGHSICYYADKVGQLFPRDQFLTEHRIQSYLGAPLFGSLGEPLGVLVVMHDGPTDLSEPLTRGLMGMLASRAAGELERQRAERALNQERLLLEQRVAERTAELRIANAALEEEIRRHRETEDALRQSQQRYEGILNAQRTLIVRVDPSNRITYQNEAYARAFGLNVGETFLVKVHPDDHDRTRQAMDALMRPPYTCEVEQRTLVGDEWRWIYWQDSVVRDRDGRIVEIQGVGFDIHDRKCIEEALRQSQQRYQGILSAQRTLIVRVDLDFRITYCNEPYARAYGLNVGDSSLVKVHQDDQERTRRALETLMRPPHTYELEERSLVGGEWRWIHWQDSVIRDRDGQIVEIQGVGFDIHDRKCAEEALRDSEERFRASFDQCPVSIQLLAPDGRLLHVNRGYEQLWGLCEQDVVGSNVLESERVRRMGLMPQIQAAFAGEIVVLPPLHVIIERGPWKGSERWVQATLYPVKNAAGTLREVVIVQADITERRKAEQSLRDSEQQYRQAAEFNQRLLLELDHRVRNNLAGLLGLLNMTRQKAGDVQSFARAIEGRLRAMAHVHELLADADWQALDLRTLMQSLLENVQGMARHPTPVELSGPAVTIRPQHTLPMSMILIEWFTNSSKYGAHSSGSGSVAIVWEVQAAGPGQRLCLRWTESGGPPIRSAPAPSLGSELVEGFVRMELSGQVELRYPSTGADHRVEFAL